MKTAVVSLMACCVLLGGCSHWLAPSSLEASWLEQPPASIKLDVPFVPSKTQDCGSTGLAMMQAFYGETPDAEGLYARLALPAKAGILRQDIQIEAQHLGFLDEVIVPSEANLVTALADDKPVLVLQKLPSFSEQGWHYALVVGIDVEAKKVWLHTGESSFEEVPLRLFLRTLEAKKWGLVLHHESLPSSADEATFTRSVVRMIQRDRLGRAHHWLTQAKAQWSSNPRWDWLMGNIAMKQKRYDLAKAAYQSSLRLDSDYALAWANLYELNQVADGALGASETNQATLLSCACGSSQQTLLPNKWREANCTSEQKVSCERSF